MRSKARCSQPLVRSRRAQREVASYLYYIIGNINLMFKTEHGMVAGRRKRDGMKTRIVWSIGMGNGWGSYPRWNFDF